jgi:uncharacterized integral membrane protein
LAICQADPVYEQRRDDGGIRRTRTGISPALIAALVVVAGAIVFIVQNTERAQIQFLFVERRMAVWVAIAIAIVVGVILDRLLSAWWRRRRRDDPNR